MNMKKKNKGVMARALIIINILRLWYLINTGSVFAMMNYTPSLWYITNI